MKRKFEIAFGSVTLVVGLALFAVIHFTDAEIESAKYFASRSMPTFNPCGAKLLSDDALKDIFQKSIVIRRSPGYYYGRFGIIYSYARPGISHYIELPYGKYIVIGSAVCTFSFNRQVYGCRHYGVKDHKLYNVWTGAQPGAWFPTDHPYFDAGCNRVDLMKVEWM